MGIIIKQSLKGSIYSYIGLVIGYINIGIIMPRVFQPEQIGLVQLFAALGIVFSNFSLLGFGGVINRMFPEFRNKKENHHGFAFLALFTSLLGFSLSVAAFFIFKPYLIESNIQKSPLFVEYIYLLIPLFFFRILINILDNYNKVLYDAVTGTFWNDFIHKLVNLLLIISFALGFLNFRQFFFGYIVSLSLPAFPLLFVLIKRKELNLKPDFSFLNRPLIREMAIVAAFGLLNGLSGTLTSNVDKLMVNQFLSLEQVGIFSVCALFATIINVPSRSMVKISTGIIAQSWKENRIAHIQEIYSKASLTQTIIGLLIFIGLLINLDHIFTILPETYSQGKWVLVIYSLGMVVRVSNTTSGVILSTSKYYKILTLIIALQILFMISMHVTLIPVWAITGAAMAVFLTYLFRTIAITGFLKYKMNLFCYTSKHLIVIGVAVLAFGISWLVPNTNILIPDILIKSFLVTSIYTFLIVKLKISKDINQMVFSILKKIKPLLKR